MAKPYQGIDPWDPWIVDPWTNPMTLADGRSVSWDKPGTHPGSDRLVQMRDNAARRGSVR